MPVMAPLAAAKLRAPPGRKDYKQECSTQWRMGETVWPLQASVSGIGTGVPDREWLLSWTSVLGGRLADER